MGEEIIMKLLKKLSLAGIIFLMVVSTTKASRNFDSDNPPNPMDAKSLTLTIFNNTNMKIKVSFFLENKKMYHGKIIESGNSLIFDVEGRYNKKSAYFRFRQAGDQFKGTGVRFFYKQVAKSRGSKVDEIYLLQDDRGNFIISATPEANEVTTILKADINAKLSEVSSAQKHKSSKKKDRK
jgi:hypothetical protein